MQAHQQRVVAEKKELDERLTKLNAFVGGDAFCNLSMDEEWLLREQRAEMEAYSRILERRIAMFPKTEGLDLTSDAPLAPACDLSGEGTCESCQ